MWFSLPRTVCDAEAHEKKQQEKKNTFKQVEKADGGKKAGNHQK